MSILFVDPRGRFMLGLAIVCLLLGIAAMKVMIREEFALTMFGNIHYRGAG